MRSDNNAQILSYRFRKGILRKRLKIIYIKQKIFILKSPEH